MNKKIILSISFVIMMSLGLAQFATSAPSQPAKKPASQTSNIINTTSLNIGYN